VQEVVASWRATGGEPDIARQMPALLKDAGFRVTGARPLGFAALPNESAWHWPAGFVRTNVPRLLELGRVDAAWAKAVLDDLTAAEADPGSLFLSPQVLEITAERL
jgi:hypothetical protein